MAARGNGGRDRPFCQLCGVEVNSEQQLDQHVSGQGHRTRLREQGQGEVMPSSPFYCNECDVSANSQKSLDEHLKSKRHRQKKLQLGKNESPKFKQDNLPDSPLDVTPDILLDVSQEVVDPNRKDTNDRIPAENFTTENAKSSNCEEGHESETVSMESDCDLDASFKLKAFLKGTGILHSSTSETRQEEVIVQSQIDPDQAIPIAPSGSVTEDDGSNITSDEKLGAKPKNRSAKRRKPSRHESSVGDDGSLVKGKKRRKSGL